MNANLLTDGRALALGLMLVIGLVTCVRADMVKLNDGRVLEGEILSEDDVQMVIEVARAGGTILKRETVKKADIAQITRLTPEQKAERAMEAAFKNLQRYKLDPSTSQAVSYYDQVVTEVLRKFLTQYPATPHRQDVEDQITEWQAERDIVASGKTKLRGQWLSTVEANKLLEQERYQQALRRAQELISAQNFDVAISGLKPLLNSRDATVAGEAARLGREAYRLWLVALDTQLKASANEMQFNEQRLLRARESTSAARRNLQEFKGTHADTGLGYRPLLNQHEGSVQRAETEEKSLEVRLSQIRDQNSVLQRRISDVQVRAGSVPDSPTSIAVAKDAGKTDTQVTMAADAARVQRQNDPETFLGQMGKWLSENWLIAGAGLLILCYVFWKFFIR